MTTDPRLRVLRPLLVSVLLTGAGPLAAERPPAPPAPAQAAHQVIQPEGLRGRLLRDEVSPVRSLDPAVFTGISPVSASDPAVRLPDDQQVDVAPTSGDGRGAN